MSCGTARYADSDDSIELAFDPCFRIRVILLLPDQMRIIKVGAARRKSGMLERVQYLNRPTFL